MKQFKPFKHKQVIDLKHMEIYDHVTHGDLSIYKIEESDLPADFESLEDVDFGVLAEGEAHAHAHQLFNDSDKPVPAFKLIEGGSSEAVKFTLKKSKKGHMYLRIDSDTLLLKHQTHNPFRLYRGLYDVDFQIEADHEGEIRRVLD